VQQRPLGLELQFGREHRVCRELRFGGLQLPRTVMDVRTIQSACGGKRVEAVPLRQEVVEASCNRRLIVFRSGRRQLRIAPAGHAHPAEVTRTRSSRPCWTPLSTTNAPESAAVDRELLLSAPNGRFCAGCQWNDRCGQELSCLLIERSAER
jgi:hypothetical protein